MMTFLPYANFRHSAEVLDRQRLGKQRVENLQILRAILDPHAIGWRNHPVVKMWNGYEWALMEYQEAICKEWTNRRYSDTCLMKSLELLDALAEPYADQPYPVWINDEELHASHRQVLLHKNYDWYSQFFHDELVGIPEYKWPVELRR